MCTLLSPWVSAAALQEVLVSSPGTPLMQFVANRWLAVDELDGDTYATLRPSSGGQGPVMHKYRIHVSTCRGRSVA